MGLWFFSFLTNLFVSLLMLLGAFILYSKWVYGQWTRNKIVQLNPVLFFGDTKSIILNTNCIGFALKDMYDKFKAMKVPIGGFYFGLRPELIIVDLDIMKSILVKDFMHFTDRGNFADEENDPLTAHLFNLDGAKWKNLRTKLTSTFTSGKMKMMFNTLLACSEGLKDILEEKTRTAQPLDIKDILISFTIDVIGSCVFGINCNCLKNPNTDFKKYGLAVFDPPSLQDKYRGILGLIFPNFFKFFKIKKLNTDISNFFLNVVRNTVKYREDNNIIRKDFLHLLLQLKNQGKVSGDTDLGTVKSSGAINNLTIEQIAAQSFVFFLAGFESSSTTMTFCLYELTKNHAIQDKVRAEIRNVLNKYNGEVTYDAIKDMKYMDQVVNVHNGKVTYDAIQEMKYMDQVVNETLRKYPALPFLVRECTKDYKLPNIDYVIKKGDHIRLSLLGIQRDPDIFPEPEKFDPERFSDKQKTSRHPVAFIPFGEGPRNCIAFRFGLMQTKIGLTVLLNDYKFTLNSKTKEPLVMNPNHFLLCPIDAIWLDSHKIV